MTHDHKAFMDLMNAVLQAARRVVQLRFQQEDPSIDALRSEINALDDHLVREATANYLEQRTEGTN